MKTVGQLLDEYASVNTVLYDVERRTDGFRWMTQAQSDDAHNQGREIQNRIRRELVERGVFQTINDSIPDLAARISHVYSVK